MKISCLSFSGTPICFIFHSAAWAHKLCTFLLWMPPTSFSPHTCHTISLTIYRQQEQPESLLTCFKIEGRNVSGSYQCGQSWELMWRTHVWTRGAKEDRAQDTKSWWQHSSDALVLPLAALWPTVASWHAGGTGRGRYLHCDCPANITGVTWVSWVMEGMRSVISQG